MYDLDLFPQVWSQRDDDVDLFSSTPPPVQKGSSIVERSFQKIRSLPRRFAYSDQVSLADRANSAEQLEWLNRTAIPLDGVMAEFEVAVREVQTKRSHRSKGWIRSVFFGLGGISIGMCLVWMVRFYHELTGDLGNAFLLTEAVGLGGLLVADATRRMARINAALPINLIFTYLFVGFFLWGTGSRDYEKYSAEFWPVALIALGQLLLFAFWVMVTLGFGDGSFIPRLRRALVRGHTEAYLSARLIDAAGSDTRRWRLSAGGVKALEEVADHIQFDVYADRKTGIRQLDAALRRDLWQVAAALRASVNLSVTPPVIAKSCLIDSIQALYLRRWDRLERSEEVPTKWSFVGAWLPSAYPVVALLTLGVLSLAARLIPSDAMHGILGNFGKTSALQILVAAVALIVPLVTYLSSNKS